MSMVMKIKEPITFSPDLQVDDALAVYWLKQVTLRLRREICWCWHERGILPNSNQAALPPLMDKAEASLNMTRYWEEKKKFFQTNPTARYLTEQLEADPPCPDNCSTRGSMSWVIKELNLDENASFMLALGLAITFDNAMGSVIASCLNDPARTYPNMALVQRLWDRPETALTLAAPSHPLFRYGLLQDVGRGSHNYSVIDWEAPLASPILVANQLLFPDLPMTEALTSVKTENDEASIFTDTVHLIASRLNSKSGDTLHIVPICGSKGASCIEMVCGIGRITNRNIVEFKGNPCLLENNTYLKSLATLCWLRGVDIFLSQEQVSILGGEKRLLDANLNPLQSIPINIFLGITEKAQLKNIPDSLLLPIIDIPTFSYHERIDCWEKGLGKKAKGLDKAISECSRRFRYEKETINSIAKGLPEMITKNDLIEACRAELELDIGELAQKVTPCFRDEELILPHKQQLQFQEIIKAMKSLTEVHYGWGTANVWNESGISVLFAGPPGTGKTMAAEILAIKLDLPMYRIDLSQVVNKYIGETEKNLKKLFDAADISDMILFFDEADSLFGRRTEVKDAHDRYANLEISYLLERMERFKGLAILATNRKKDLDEAFLRRLRHIIDFSLPEMEQREKIWRQVVPNSVDASKIDFSFLARQFSLAGGHIRSIIFNACLQSADGLNPGHDGFKGRLTMEQIIVAVKREYDKLNRSVSLEHFGAYAEIVKKLEHKDERG